MPAGLVLAVVAIALVMAMFFNATATERKSRANVACDGCWRQSVAGWVSGASSFLHLSDPRDRMDGAMGKNQSSEVSTDELLAHQREAEQSRQAAPAAAAAASAPSSTAPQPVRPVLRVPAPGSPLKLWVGGDSIMVALGPAIQRIASETGLFSPTIEPKVSTGLSRPDYFNWPEHLARDVMPTVDPDVVVVTFGGNDAQNIPLPNKGRLDRYSPEWLAEYRKRVAATMDLLRSPDNDRLVIWVGALIMGPTAGVEGMEKLNYIYWSEAQTRPWVAYFDSWAFFADPAGRYAVSLPFADGKSRPVRASDNIHLNIAGADRLGWAVMGRLGQLIDLSRSVAAPPLDQLPPLDLKERTEVPALS